MIFRDIRAPQSEVFETVHGWRIHADHQQVQPAIRVEIGQGVTHAEANGISNKLAGNFNEMPVPVISIEIQACEITHHQKIEMFVAVETHERAAIGAPPALRFETGTFRGVSE